MNGNIFTRERIDKIIREGDIREEIGGDKNRE